MTDTTPTLSPAVVTEADRLIASQLIEALSPHLRDKDAWLVTAEALRNGAKGHVDRRFVPETFARHRLSSLASSERPVERGQIESALRYARDQADSVYGITWAKLEEISRFELFVQALSLAKPDAILAALKRSPAESGHSEALRRIRDLSGDADWRVIQAIADAALRTTPPAESGGGFRDGLEKAAAIATQISDREAGLANDMPAGGDWQKHKHASNVALDIACLIRVETLAAPPPAESGGAQATAVGEHAYLVWSNEHKAWWGHYHCGYTRIIGNAGRYDRAEALKIAGTRDGGWRLNKGNPDEIAMPEQDAIDQYASITRAQEAGALKSQGAA